MSGLSDAALRHLREVTDEPDLSDTPYEILDTLGRGGMGTVYLAHDRRLDREVALKVVQLPEGAGNLERLMREARVLARLEHPGIVPVHAVALAAAGAWTSTPAPCPSPSASAPLSASARPSPSPTPTA